MAESIVGTCICLKQFKLVIQVLISFNPCFSNLPIVQPTFGRPTGADALGEVDCGMVHGHAYSLLHAVEVDGVRLIACRNPWGSDSEWNGPWSDRSEEWKANPTIAMLGEMSDPRSNSSNFTINSQQ